MKSAMQLQTIQDNWDDLQDTLGDALFYNRRLWSVFVSSVSREDNQLPRPIAQNIMNLGLFVFNQTLKAQTKKKPELLTSLISINQQLALGLRGAAGDEEEESQAEASTTSTPPAAVQASV